MRAVFAWIARLIVIVVAGVLALQVYFFVCIGWWTQFNPGSTRFMRDQMAQLRVRDPELRLAHQWVPSATISTHLKRAVITAEDAKFVDHPGVDWGAIEKAYAYNQKNERRGRKRVKGGSTITQQLAKNLFLTSNRSYVRKGQELVITYMLEFWMSKQRILEIYLNVVEWGNGVYGAEAAARHYFGVPASRLSSYQAARMAAMLPNPRFYDRHRGSSYLARKTSAIQRWMPDAELP